MKGSGAICIQFMLAICPFRHRRGSGHGLGGDAPAISFSGENVIMGVPIWRLQILP